MYKTVVVKLMNSSFNCLRASQSNSVDVPAKSWNARPSQKEKSLPPSTEREKTEREIAVTDEKIDEIVYGLYGITEEEKRIIQDSK